MVAVACGVWVEVTVGDGVTVAGSTTLVTKEHASRATLRNNIFKIWSPFLIFIRPPFGISNILLHPFRTVGLFGE
jgi:hypothetical protein